MENNALGPVAIDYAVDGPRTAASVAGRRTHLRGMSYAIPGQAPCFVSSGLSDVLHGLGNRKRIYYDAVFGIALEMQNGLPLPAFFEDARSMQQLASKGLPRLCDTLAPAGTPQRAQELRMMYNRLRGDPAFDSLFRVYQEIELPVIAPTISMTLAGCRINRAFLEEIKIASTEQVIVAQRRLNEIAGKPLNLNNACDIADFLYHDLRLPVVDYTKNRNPSISTAVLEVIVDAHPAVRILLDYKKHRSLQSTADAMLRSLTPDSCVHTHLDPFGADTGRFAAKDPPLQSLDRRLRAAVVTIPGRVLLEADYSQMEFRVLAHFSRDSVLLDAFQSGADLHRRTAAMIFGMPESDVNAKQRQLGKTANFAIIYGQTAQGLARQLGLSLGEAEAFVAAHEAAFPGVAAWVASVHSHVARTREVRTLFDRSRALPHISSADPTQRAEALRQAVNTIIQGTAADLLKLALIRLHNTLPVEVRLLLTVHDSVLLEVPEHLLAETRELVRLIMEEPPPGFTVPLRVDIGRGKTWADCHDVGNH